MRPFPAWFWALAALIALGACDRLPGLARSGALTRGPPVAMGPWLLDPGAQTMTVSWASDTPSVGRVWYGTGAADHLATEPGAPALDHRVVLGLLSPQTQYRYRIDGSDDSSIFTTAPEPGGDGPVEVLVYGDNRSNSGDHALVARAAAAEHAQVALHTGDMVVDAKEGDLWRT